MAAQEVVLQIPHWESYQMDDIGGKQMTRLEMQEKAMDLFMKHFH